MKKITITILMITLFSTITNAQNNFNNLWLKVERFEVDNLPKSALKIVEEIYTKAEKEDNSAQIIKTKDGVSIGKRSDLIASCTKGVI